MLIADHEITKQCFYRKIFEMKKFVNHMLAAAMAAVGIFSAGVAFAQTDLDAIMMNKHQFCQGIMYDYSSWDHYWEGTFKRDNANLGTVSTQALMYMPNYGITNNLNVMASVPYVWTKASEGVLHGMSGMQDLSVYVKWRPLVKSFGKNQFSLFTIGGFTTPLSNYVTEFLPMSIGLGSTNLSARGMVDYRRDHFTATVSATYTWRSNVKLDKDAYYDTELHLTDEVKMPNVTMYQLRTGYRGKYLIAEALLTKTNTLGGYDITKNNGQLYPNLKMNSTVVGVNIKYTLKQFTNLAFTAGAGYTVAGRNVGQSKTVGVGAYYVIYLGKKTKS
jgi:Putative MetA-pathway of phenol degradation